MNALSKLKKKHTTEKAKCNFPVPSKKFSKDSKSKEVLQSQFKFSERVENYIRQKNQITSINFELSHCKRLKKLCMVTLG